MSPSAQWKAATITVVVTLLLLAYFPDFVISTSLGAIATLAVLWFILVPRSRWIVIAAGSLGFIWYSILLAEVKSFVGLWPGLLPAFTLAALAYLTYRRNNTAALTGPDRP